MFSLYHKIAIYIAAITLNSWLLNLTTTNVFGYISPRHLKLYLRFVDDIFCVFNNETSSDKFLDLLNKQQKSIEVTVEDGSETLSFLDVEVTITEFGVKTMIYSKQSRTILPLNFNAICLIN